MDGKINDQKIAKKTILSTLHERINTLNDALKEIREAIESRKDLSKKFKDQIEKELKNTLIYLVPVLKPLFSQSA